MFLVEIVSHQVMETARSTRNTRKSFARRCVNFIKKCVILAISVAILYVVALNVFLSSHQLSRLLNDPSDVKIDYDRAYSLYPGHVHVEKLSLLAYDSNVEWNLLIDTCDFVWKPWHMAKRLFAADHVHGEGISMRIRLRMEGLDATDLVTNALPPVPGFSDPPLKQIGPKPAPLTDENYNLWSVSLEDVDAKNVREIWVHTMRVAGDMRIRGRWFFRPVRWLDIGPAIVDINESTFAFGSAPIAGSIQGSLRTTVHPFDVREPKGADVLRYVSLSGPIRGNLFTEAGLDRFVDIENVRIEKGEGPFNASLQINHGLLEPGTHADVTLSNEQLRASSAELRADARVSFDVTNEPGGPVGTAALSIDHGSAVIEATQPKPRLSVAAIQLKVRSNDLQLADPFDDATYEANIDHAATSTLSAWKAFLSPTMPFELHDSPVTMNAALHGSLADQTAEGALSFEAPALRITRHEGELIAGIRGQASIVHASLPDRTLNLDGSRASVSNARAFIEGIHGTVRSIDVSLPRARISRNAPDVDVRATIAGGSFPDLNEMNRIFSRKKGPPATLGGSAGFEGKVGIHLPNPNVRGELSLQTTNLSLKGEKLLMRSELAAKVKVRSWDTEASAIDLSGSELTLTKTEIITQTEGEPIPPMVVPIASVNLQAFSLDKKEGRRGVVHFRLPEATTADLGGFSDMFPIPRVITLLGGTTRASGLLDVDADTLAVNGKVTVDTKGLEMRVGTKSVRGDLVATIVARANQDGSTSFNGTTLSFQEPTAATEGEKPWWAKVELRGTMRASPDFTTNAHVLVRARDASPGTEVLSSETGIPHWAANLFTMNDLHAEGDVQLGPDQLRIQNLRANGDGASFSMEYAKNGEQSRGAIQVGAAGFGANVGLINGSTNVMLVPAADWYEKETREIRALPIAARVAPVDRE